MVIPFTCHLRSLGLDGFINNFGSANNLACTVALSAVSVRGHRSEKVCCTKNGFFKHKPGWIQFSLFFFRLDWSYLMP